MNLQVRVVEGFEAKSIQEREKELLDKHEQKLNEEVAGAGDDDKGAGDDDKGAGDESKEIDFKETDVLSYIGKRYNKQIDSLDDLINARKEAEELPEDVAAYFKYKKETGRGFEDFIELKKDFSSMNEDSLLKTYLLKTQEGLDESDIETLMDDYRYDEDLDDASDIKKTKLAKKKIVAEAKKYFTQQQETYKIPLESSVVKGIPDEEKETYESFKQYTQQAKTQQEQESVKRDWFQKKSDEVFNGEFKGFEFNIDDKKFVFTPGDATELKKIQSTPMNFISKFLDENGLIKDAAGYHRALAMAMNPEKAARYFYEQGLAAATDDVTRKIKNINMSERKAPEVMSKGGFQVKAKDDSSGRSLKIRSNKKN
jgi:hypothetical protein